MGSFYFMIVKWTNIRRYKNVETYENSACTAGGRLSWEALNTINHFDTFIRVNNDYIIGTNTTYYFFSRDLNRYPR